MADLQSAIFSRMSTSQLSYRRLQICGNVICNPSCYGRFAICHISPHVYSAAVIPHTADYKSAVTCYKSAVTWVLYYSILTIPANCTK